MLTKCLVVMLTREQAFQELAKGERTATVLENQLSTMEAKIEELLARAEREQQEVQKIRETKSSSGGGKVEPNGSK